MNLTQILTLAGGHKRRRRLGRGRGSGCGKTSGRGHKGAGSRSGYKSRGMAEGGAMPFFRRIPKRGFSNFAFTTRYQVINVSDLEEVFSAGAHVTPESLREAGLVRNLKLPIKVLGNGELTKKLMVDAARFSESAKAKIEAVGGVIRVAE